MKRLSLYFAAIALALCAISTGPRAHAIGAAATPPPSPPPITIAPTAGPIGAPNTPQPGQVIVPVNGAASPSPADDRKNLDGVWEVVLQPMNGDPVYDHLKLVQKVNIITGTFMDNEHGNKQYPVAGSIDGKTVHIVVTKDDGSTIRFNGTVDNLTDMIGLVQMGSASIAFTAAYRPKYKFIDTIAPMPGGGGLGTGNGRP